MASLLLITGCFENTKVEKKPIKEHNLTEINATKEPTVHYSKKQLELKQEFELYLEQLKSLNTDNIIAMTYPKLFIPINRTIFKHYIDSLLTSPHIAVESFDTNITNIGEVQSHSSGLFAQIRYNSVIKLGFIDPELYSDELSIRVLNDVLAGKYGQENIKIDSKERTISITKEERLLSIKEENQRWKFIGDNQEYRRLYPRILPLDILSKI
jgi:hypothetical protein